MTVTIAGVNKKKGSIELGTIDKFKEGFIFSDAGGTESVYNDEPEIAFYEIDGKIIAITSNVVLKDSTYTLGVTADYRRLLDESRIA